MQRSASKPKKINEKKMIKNLSYFVKKNENDISDVLTTLTDYNKKLDVYEEKLQCYEDTLNNLQDELEKVISMIKKEANISLRTNKVNCGLIDSMRLMNEKMNSLESKLTNSDEPIEEPADSFQSSKTIVTINNDCGLDSDNMDSSIDLSE